MKEKIRNKMIETSYSKHLDAKIMLVLAGLTILGLIIGHFGLLHADFLVGLLFISGVAIFWIWQCFDAIKKYDKEVVKRNKLINIILSDNYVWDIPFIFGVILPTAIIINAKLEFAIALTVLMILAMIVAIFINVVSKSFKDKIIE